VSDGQGTAGFRQIIIHRVIGRVDIDPTSGRRFLKIGILESPEGLDLLVGGQLPLCL
jgi:hypothetical protein